MDPIELAKLLPDLDQLEHRSTPVVRWVRLRNVDMNQVDATRAALRKLRASGWRTCVLVRRNVTNWKVSYLPDDLGESYEIAKKLGATFWGLVDAWEIDNEPDLGFVPELPERYVAYLKASYLGLKAGIAEQGKRAPHEPESIGSPTSSNRAPLVVMGSLGLPPGPWLESFAANGGFSYTDGYNFHFYGYSPDFGPVFQLHESVFKELSTDQSAAERRFKVFITEIGYGMLGKDSRNTATGRLSQWRWFKSIGQQLALLRPEAPMAFCLPPYLEYGRSEFGLTMPMSTDLQAGLQSKPEAPDRSAPMEAQFPPEPWTNLIRKAVNSYTTTPALAWWWSASPRYTPQDWRAAPASPSPVVLDFLPGQGLLPVKRYLGHVVSGVPELPAPKSDLSPPTVASPPPSSGEIIPQIRAENGNIFEVYPTRQATPSWQEFFEPGRNFGLTFYGRAQQPWRFRDNRPAALVLLIYPKGLPATFEFRRIQIVRLVDAASKSSVRVGHGSIVVYNFTDQRVTGRLVLPSGMKFSQQIAAESPAMLDLAPHARHVVPVDIVLNSGASPPCKVAVTFEQQTPTREQSRLQTSFLPDPAGLRTETIASFLPPSAADTSRESSQPAPAAPPRIEDDLVLVEQKLGGGDFAAGPRISAPTGTRIERTSSGFVITVDRLESGRSRSEVEISWPRGATLQATDYLSMGFREVPSN